MNNSRYQLLTGSEPNVDPYTLASPDLYQDVFQEGSFSGKGIYDLDIFNMLHDRFPENRILSHDLLEGCYVRSGLLSDIKLYERAVGYLPDVKRRHRWIRGDWQIAAWAGWFVPAPGGHLKRNTLSALSRWKIMDNLRLSLLPTSSLLLIVLALILLPDPLFWTFFVMLVLLFPAALLFTGKIIEKRAELFFWRHWKGAVNESASRFMLNVFDIVTLPFTAFYTLDAIIRAWWRILVTRRKLLEWVLSGSLNHLQNSRLRQLFSIMWMGPALGLAIAVYLIVFKPLVLLWLSPLLLLWLCSPVVAWWMSNSREMTKQVVPATEYSFLRRLARKTWAYFEHFINEDNNWLPPDHYQQYPMQKLADYTSPTNIGLSLLAGLSARDLGYISSGKFIHMTSGTLHIMNRLERYKGHFYNWYDTHTLKPIQPGYISTVDSGNLAGHLLVLRQALSTLPGEMCFDAALFNGLLDTMQVLVEETSAIDRLEQYVTKLAALARIEINTLDQFIMGVQQASSIIDEAGIALGAQCHAEATRWLAVLKKQVADIREEIQLLVPWSGLTPAPTVYNDLLPQQIPTLTELENSTRQLLDSSVLWDTAKNAEEKDWLQTLKDCLVQSNATVTGRLALVERLMKICTGFADMEYEFLFNQTDLLLSIGYFPDAGQADAECYDMLASEARMATYVGICQNKLPVKSWFVLGRPLVSEGGLLVMLSANGTMFEYLMPMLVMPAFNNTLLHRACQSAVKKQIEYGNNNKIPWGISEAGYNTIDENLNYQYRVFGVPGLSLKHYYSDDDKVIAPYATVMALMIDREAACKNLERLAAAECYGQYGFF